MFNFYVGVFSKIREASDQMCRRCCEKKNQGPSQNVIVKCCDKEDGQCEELQLPLFVRGVGLSLQNAEPSPYQGGVLVAKCRIFDEKFKMIGTAQSTIVDQGVNIVHDWELVDGSKLSIKVPNTLSLTLAGALDQKFADAFPSVQNLVGQDAGYVIFQGDYFKNNTNIISWSGSGVFADCAYEESRCTYTTFPGTDVEAPIFTCQSCMWYFTKAPLFQ